MIISTKHCKEGKVNMNMVSRGQSVHEHCMMFNNLIADIGGHVGDVDMMRRGTLAVETTLYERCPKLSCSNGASYCRV